MKMLKTTLAVLTAAAALGAVSNAQAGATLDAVKKKGFVQCGVSDGLPGFSVPDAQGKIVGIDADVCRAVAAAVFGDATKVKFSQLNAKERFTALQSGEVDVLSRNTTWTSSRDAGMAWCSRVSPTMTASASWSTRSWVSPVPRNSMVRPSVSRPVPPPS